MEFTKSIFLLILILGFRICKKTSQIQAIEIGSTNYYMCTRARINCEDFFTLFKVNRTTYPELYHHTRIINRDTIDLFAGLMTQLTRSAGSPYELDIRAKMVIETVNSSDTICVDRFRLLYKGEMYLLDDEMKHLIWGNIK
jgi:hypothetical protein